MLCSVVYSVSKGMMKDCFNIVELFFTNPFLDYFSFSFIHISVDLEMVQKEKNLRESFFYFWV